MNTINLDNICEQCDCKNCEGICLRCYWNPLFCPMHFEEELKQEATEQQVDVIKKMYLNMCENDVLKYIDTFNNLKLNDLKLLSRKTIEFGKIKAIKKQFDAYVSSSEETIGGNSNHELVNRILQFRYGNCEISTDQAFDYKFKINKTSYHLQIKNSPNWGNRDQKDKFKDNLNKTRMDYENIPVLLCLSEVSNRCEIKTTNKFDFYCLCGNAAWFFISGITNFKEVILSNLNIVDRIREKYNKVEELTLQRIQNEARNTDR